MKKNLFSLEDTLAVEIESTNDSHNIFSINFLNFTTNCSNEIT